jgi:hypothetical protein
MGQASLVSLPAQSVLVTENFTSKLVTLDELSKFSSCAFGGVAETFVLPLPTDVLSLFRSESQTSLSANVLSVVGDYLRQVYDDVQLNLHGSSEHSSSNSMYEQASLSVQGEMLRVTVGEGERSLRVTWQASPVSDLLADSVAGLLMQFFSATQLVKMTIQAQSRHRDVTNNSNQSRKTPLRMGSEAASLRKKRKETKAAQPQPLSVALEGTWRAIDPSRSLPPSVRALSSTVLLDALRGQLLSLPEAQRLFGEVKLSSDGQRLIFRGQPGSSYSFCKAEGDDPNPVLQLDDVSVQPSLNGSEDSLEAFVVIAFADNDASRGSDREGAAHRAAVQCADETFSKVVSVALQSMR